MPTQNSSIRIYVLILFLLVAGLTGCTAIRPVVLDHPPAVDEPVFSHDYLDRVVGKYVDDDGMVDYQALQSDPQELERYYSLLTRYSPDSHPALFPSENHKLAYWINGYNAAVLKTVLVYYPIDSVLDVKTPLVFAILSDKAGFFFFQRITFGEKTTSLYYLENSVIRKRFDEPRIHFALNCASLGCPRLPKVAFRAESLDEQLEYETRRFLTEERNFRIDHAAKAIYLSMIFEWFEDDFTDWYSKRFPGHPANLLSYIELYLPAEKAAELHRVKSEYAVRFTPYDWRLNDQPVSSSAHRSALLER